MRIVFTGGGTAGHVMPNIALINCLKPEDEVYYFGGDGMEKRLIADKTANVNYVEIQAAKFKRSFSLSNCLLPFKLIASISQCKKALNQIRPDVIFSKGGYVSLPVAIAGNCLKIPVIVHESDVSVGLTNKLCAKKSFAFLTSFECSQIKKAMQVGCPIRQEIYSADKVRGLKTMDFDGHKPILLFLGGSQGAKQLNTFAEEVYPRLKRKFDIFVVTGKNKEVNNAVGFHSIEFLDNIYDVIKASSFCVTRGGANTLCELVALNVPFLSIPLTGATRGEQVLNAQYFAKKGCGAILTGEFYAEQLANKIIQMHAKIPLFKQGQKAVKIDGTLDILKTIYSAANIH